MLFGGIVGFAYYKSNIDRCYNTGEIIGDYQVGGIIGCMDYATITNCYNKGNIKGVNAVGGIIGIVGSYMNTTGYEYLYSCYNTEIVTGNDGQAGSIIGRTQYVTVDYTYGLTGTNKVMAGYYGPNNAGATNTGFFNASSNYTTLRNNLNIRNAGVWAVNSGINGGFPYLVGLKP